MSNSLYISPCSCSTESWRALFGYALAPGTGGDARLCSLILATPTIDIDTSNKFLIGPPTSKHSSAGDHMPLWTSSGPASASMCISATGSHAHVILTRPRTSKHVSAADHMPM